MISLTNETRTTMNKIEDMPVSKALASGLAKRCPLCRLVLPAARFNHPEHPRYCSVRCFKGQEKGAAK